jgi:adhesin/invasin
VEAGEQTVNVPVTLVQERARPILGLNLTGLRFEARQGEGHANNRNVLVLNLGQDTVNWQAEVLHGREWLSLVAARGQATPEEFGRLGLNADPGVLSPGPYYALVRVTDPAAANSPQFISAVLNVSSAADDPSPDPSPQGLFFVGDPGEPPPQNQPMRMFVSSRTPVAFQASASTEDGANWLRVQPETGVTSTGETTTLRVTVDPRVVEPGIYSGEVTVAFADRSIRTTNVTLVAAAGVAGPITPSNARTAAACVPSRLSLTQTGLVNSFVSTAGWPTPLIVRLADNCGGPVLNAGMVANFSNGDPPLSMQLTNAQVGLYSATWLPRGAGDSVVTATATAPGLGTARADIIGAVTASREAPVLHPGAVMNAFYPVPGAPVAPGTPVQIFGDHMSSATAAASSAPLPSSLEETSFVIGGREAPLFYVSPGQVNAQVPPGLEANTQHAAVILSGDRYTVADPLVIVRAGPALIASGGSVFAQHADSTLVTAASPARAGEEVTILASGLGATTPEVAAGDVPPPGATAQAAIPLRVTIGGRPAALRSASLSPELVGMYGVTIEIPAGLPAGPAPVEIEQDGTVSNRASIHVAP